MTILLAIQDKSVSFHFTKNLDLDELGFFELTSVVCRHRHVLTWSWWVSEVAYSGKLIFFFSNEILKYKYNNYTNMSQNTSNFYWKNNSLVWFSANLVNATSEAHRLHMFSFSSALSSCEETSEQRRRKKLKKLNKTEFFSS